VLHQTALPFCTISYSLRPRLSLRSHFRSRMSHRISDTTPPPHHLQTRQRTFERPPALRRHALHPILAPRWSWNPPAPRSRPRRLWKTVKTMKLMSMLSFPLPLLPHNHPPSRRTVYRDRATVPPLHGPRESRRTAIATVVATAAWGWD
jgi:hypothetical protein